ncbi:INO80 complex subunit Ies4-domain-containing protein [Massariosphaeria phaeospora]|uniref:INO80 complex subunit Ies4-domain-containing protein n=1 Tax=Massariosphaeria phaeospora TaxID=100035 RepID=A0A7C8M4L4_9PLEO|nr:INO80 complex subunit Ies4-domain-containing protein [Massariosphaeria phaeospora]
MINDPNNKGPFAAPAPIQRLGPKANQGAINAGLRALDRTGKPCRKWEKKGFQLRSFTGVNWTVPTWRAPTRSAAFAEDVKSDSTGSTDSKVKDESSGLSDKSGANGTAITPVPPTMNGIASSPAPIAAPS